MYIEKWSVKNVLPTQLVTSQAKYVEPIHIGHICTLGRSFVSHTTCFQKILSHAYMCTLRDGPFSHHQQGSIDFNTANTYCPIGL